MQNKSKQKQTHRNKDQRNGSQKEEGRGVKG